MSGLLLWARASGGWGEHPNLLRVRHDRVVRALPGLIAILLAMSAIFPAADILEGMSRHRIPPLVPLLIALAPFEVGIPVLCLAPVLWWLICWGCLARRGAASSMTSAYGRCFEAHIGSPGYLYARIGLAREAARWYALPLDCDEVVEPGEAEYELTLNPGSGWVQRVRRLGASPREVSQESPVILTGAAARAQAEEERIALREFQRGEATKEERQTFNRFARAQPLGWRAESWTYAFGGWSLLFGGILFGPGLPAFFVIFALQHPHMKSDPSGRIAGIITLSAFFVIGVVLIVYGLRYLRAWRRWRPFRDEAPLTAEGEVAAWKPYRDMYSPSDYHQIKETLILLRDADGTSHIFRVPAKFAHRVRERGRMVRVAYRPTTERVVDVHQVETPAPAETSA